MSGILWKEWQFFRTRWLALTFSSAITPLLYLLTFGWGLGRHVTIQGHSYIEFVLPGILSLTAALTSYGATAMRVNTARVHESTFESLLVSPLSHFSIVLGYVLAGALRGLHGAFLVWAVTWAVAPSGFWQGTVIPALLLDCLVFSAIGYVAAVWIDNHYNMTFFASYCITPMVFLCGTFFSLERFPAWVRPVIEFLPLSLASFSIRHSAWGEPLPVIRILLLGILLLGLVTVGVRLTSREQL